MNTIKNADMPAMPIEFNGFGQYVPECHGGLTKREMFAMAAMQGILSSLTADDNFSPSEVARSALLNADALLTALEPTK